MLLREVARHYFGECFISTEGTATRLISHPDSLPAVQRLAELREAAARRRREFPDYPDSADDRAEHLELVKAFEPLQAQTFAWTARQ